MSTLKPDVFSNRQIFQDSRDHFTGRAHSVSNVLLSELLGNVERTVAAFLGQIHKQIGHSAVHILKRQALNICG